MKNIKDRIFYTNIRNTETGLREVREARITEMEARPENLIFLNGELLKLEGDFYGRIEIAGLGTYSYSEFCKELDGGIWLGKDEAIANTSSNRGFLRYYNSSSRWEMRTLWAGIHLSDLDLSHDRCEINEIKCNPCVNYSYLKVRTYYWDGTKPVRIDGDCKFRINLTDNMVVEYREENLDKLGKLYNSYEACKADNQPKVYTFSDEPETNEADEEIEFKVTAKKSDLAKLKEIGIKINY